MIFLGHEEDPRSDLLQVGNEVLELSVHFLPVPPRSFKLIKAREAPVC